MELYERNPVSESDPQVEWGPAGPVTVLQESMMRMGLGNRESFPERPGVSDCVYYMRTGFCGFGSRCRYNHPRDRSAAAAAVISGGGEYPERVGEPVCQFYLKTGTCKFGASCKFHHPKQGNGFNQVTLNSYGFPLRPGEKECSYYLKTGQCKFGVTCKFHHPQLADMSILASAPTFYPTVQSPTVRTPEQYMGRLPLVPGSYIQGAYGPMMVSPGVVPLQGWSPYSAPVSPAPSPGAQPALVAGSMYGMTSISSSTPPLPRPYTPVLPLTGPSGSSQKEAIFPERPGQPECQYYLKTGDCKFGASCRYHHRREWVVPEENSILSPLGLPMRPIYFTTVSGVHSRHNNMYNWAANSFRRPLSSQQYGVQPCAFYLQNGQCKFGVSCKYDHPLTMRYNPSASSLTDIPVAPYPVGSSLGTLAPSYSSSSELRPEFISGSQMDSHATLIPSSGSSVGLIFSQTGPVSLPDLQISGQSSTPADFSGSRSTRKGAERRRSS